MEYESKTIFDLPTSVAELPSVNQAMSRMQYDQVAPTRDVVGTAFPNGQIHTRFEISGTKRWVPSKTYIRLRCSLTSDAASAVALTSVLTCFSLANSVLLIRPFLVAPITWLKLTR